MAKRLSVLKDIWVKMMNRRFSEVETPWLKEARQQQIAAEKAIAEAMRRHELTTE